MTFLRNVQVSQDKPDRVIIQLGGIIQTGLMWRQTGPIIISMTYMIIDVLVFLFIFVIVYISFTLVVVYVYEVYDDDRTQFFNSHKSAFKLFWWSLIRTGNPHFPNIRQFDQTLHYYNSTCIGQMIGVSGQLKSLRTSITSSCSGYWRENGGGQTDRELRHGTGRDGGGV